MKKANSDLWKTLQKWNAVFRYLNRQQHNAWEAQDIDLFNYYSNGGGFLFALAQNKPYQYIDAVPERFYRKSTLKNEKFS